MIAWPAESRRLNESRRSKTETPAKRRASFEAIDGSPLRSPAQPVSLRAASERFRRHT